MLPSRTSAMRSRTPVADPMERGTRYFQQVIISWSTRRRGSVQRIWMTVKTRHVPLKTKTANESACQPRKAQPFDSAIRSGEMPGICHPPRNARVATAARIHMLAHSAKRKKRKRIPEYSMLYPAMISLSASGRSNGVRLPSAIAEMKYMMKAAKRNGLRKTNHCHGQPPCAPTIPCVERVPAINTTAISEKADGTS